MARRLSDFFSELKRRKVYRVATVYAITAWIIIEVTDTIFPRLNLPDWLVTSIIVVLLIGFPIALILSWIYDWSPEGFVRTPPADLDENPLPASKRKPFTGWITFIILVILLLTQFVFFNAVKGSRSESLPDEVISEKVAVAPFNNFTGEESLETFGLMASEWLTSGLRELDVQTSSPEMMRKCRENVGILPGNPTKEVSLYELTGASYVVTGSYYRKDNILQVSSRLESTRTGEIIYAFPEIEGTLENKEELIQDIREKLKGYWAVKEANQLSKVVPPKYEAYEALMECDGVPWAFWCHQNAISIDSTFMLPRVLYYLSSWQWDLAQENENVRQYILNHWDECTSYEKSYFHFVEQSMAVRYQAAVEALKENYSFDPRDLTVLHMLSHFYLGLNQAEVALEILEPIFENYDVFKHRLRQEVVRNYLISLGRIGQTRKALAFISGLDAEDYRLIGNWGRYQVIRMLLMEGEFKEIDALVELFEDNGIELDPETWAFAYNEIYPNSQGNQFESLLRARKTRFMDPQDTWDYGIWTHLFYHNHNSLAYYHYVLKEYEEAEEIMMELRKVDWQGFFSDPLARTNWWFTDLWVEGFLGSIFARQGKTAEAYDQIAYLESLRPEFPGFVIRQRKGAISYYQARIYAILGEKEKAVEHLELAMREGKMTENRTFDQDWDFAVLKDYQPFRDLLRLN